MSEEIKKFLKKRARERDLDTAMEKLLVLEGVLLHPEVLLLGVICGRRLTVQWKEG